MLYSFHYDMRQPEHDLGKPALAVLDQMFVMCGVTIYLQIGLCVE